MNQYTDRFLEAMRVVSNKKQQVSDFDKTIRAQISAVPTEENKYYVIEYDKLKYKVYTFYNDYIVGDIVYVRLVGGKMDGDKIIEGKVAPILQDRTITSMVELPQSKRWDGISLGKPELLGFDTQSIGQNCLRISAYFQADKITNVSFFEDLYGLQIKLSNKEEVYRFTCDQFMGNPYTGEKTFQTFDIYFDEPLETGITIEELSIIREGQYNENSVEISNISAQFLIIEDLSKTNWVMTYSTTTGFISNGGNKDVVLQPRLFYKGKEILNIDLGDNQYIIEEILTKNFEWVRRNNGKSGKVNPQEECNYSNLVLNEAYIRYKFIEVINEEEVVKAISKIIKIENTTISAPKDSEDKDIVIEQLDNYGENTTGLYMGSDFLLPAAAGTGDSAVVGAWGYGSFGDYDSYLPFVSKETPDSPYTKPELPYEDFFSIITGYANGVVMNYYPIEIKEWKEGEQGKEGEWVGTGEYQYYLLSKLYTPPTVEDQANHLTTAMNIFPKSVIVKYDADGILGSANKTYSIAPRPLFLSAATQSKLEWIYNVENFVVSYTDKFETKNEENGSTETKTNIISLPVNGYFIWTWNSKENLDGTFSWQKDGVKFIVDSVMNSFIEDYKEENNDRAFVFIKENVEQPNTKANLFASFSQGDNGELHFTAVNKYVGAYAQYNTFYLKIYAKNESKPTSYQFEVDFLADGNLGTNGTKYALVIEDFWGNENEPWVNSNDLNNLRLRAQVFDIQENEIIPEGQLSDWKWSFRGTELNEITNSYFSLLDLTTDINISPAELNYIELEVKVNTNDSNDIKLSSAYAIPYKISGLVSRFTKTNNYFQYSTDGTSLIGGKTAYFKVYYNNGVGGTFGIMDIPKEAWPENYKYISDRYAVLSEKYIYNKNGEEILSKQTPLNGALEIGKCLQLDFKTNEADLSAFLNDKKYDYFHVTYQISNTPVYNETCILNVNRFFSSLVNEWDGNVNVNDNSILTPLAVAGQKVNNAFNGVMLGAVTKEDNNVSTTKYGIFGYAEGIESFHLDSGTGKLWAQGADIEGAINAKSLTLQPEVAVQAGLTTALESGYKKCLLNDEHFENDEDIWKPQIINYNGGEGEGAIVTLTRRENINNEAYAGGRGKYVVEVSKTKFTNPKEDEKGNIIYDENGNEIIVDKNIAGGFSFSNSPNKLKKYLYIFTANIPVGYHFEFKTNNIGPTKTTDNSVSPVITNWLTSNKGSGNWETYKFYLQVSNRIAVKGESALNFWPYAGTTKDDYTKEPSKYPLANTGYFLLVKDEGEVDLGSDGFTWYLSSATYYELLDGSLVDGGNLTGDFAGWQIKSDYLRYTKPISTTNTTQYLHSYISPSATSNEYYRINDAVKNNWALYFGGSNTSGTLNNINYKGTGNFGVDQAGKLYATGADISGKIHADSLTLGNNAKIEGYATTDYVDTQVGNITQPTNTLTYSYNSATNRYIIKDPSSSGNNYISINTSGALVAENAIISGTIASGQSITGTINAKNGKIANWNIGTRDLSFTNAIIKNVSYLESKSTNIISGSGSSTSFQFQFSLREPTTRIYDRSGNAIILMSMLNSSGAWQGNNFKLSADGRIETTGLALLNLDPYEYKNSVQGLLEVNEGVITLGKAIDATSFDGNTFLKLERDKGELQGNWYVSDYDTERSLGTLLSIIFDNIKELNEAVFS